MSFGLTAVAGLEVGHFTDARRPTGCTVVIARDGAVAGVDVRGASPGTRETELLAPNNAIDKVHAIALAGGSAFGLDAASGVMRWLDERGIGASPAGAGARGADRAGGDPVRSLGRRRAHPSRRCRRLRCMRGSVARRGRRRQRRRRGRRFGGEALRHRPGDEGRSRHGVDRVGGLTVAALVAVNAVGDVVDPRTGRIVAGARSSDGTKLVGTMRALKRGELPARLDPRHAAGTATTIAVVATDAILTKPEASKVAQMAHDGLARSINPVHTMSDGDVVFALATGTSGRVATPTLVGALAAEVLADAVLRAVRAARRIGGAGLPDLPAAADLGGTNENVP